MIVIDWEGEEDEKSDEKERGVRVDADVDV